jgi:sugar transferase EpsL
MKRTFDVVVAAALLVVLAPVFAVVAVLVRMKLGSPVLFRQVRPGRHEVPFVIMKFRTMFDGSELDEARLTRLGRTLRRTSLDELPTLFNVLRGDMSFVGPRPLLVEYLPRYSPEQRRRHEVRPGVTGWAQVNGRNAISWEDKLALDLWYVAHWSLRLDLVILAKTVATVLTGSGVTAPAGTTLSPPSGADAVPGCSSSRGES